jgi:hypothetical protein
MNTSASSTSKSGASATTDSSRSEPRRGRTTDRETGDTKALALLPSRPVVRPDHTYVACSPRHFLMTSGRVRVTVRALELALLVDDNDHGPPLEPFFENQLCQRP